MLRLCDLADLHEHAPASWFGRPVHFDPDLISGIKTYGDNCRRAGRAFSLRRAHPGDVIFFLARLKKPTGPAAFHLVGFLELDDMLTDVTQEPGSGWWDANAHVRRARATGIWDSFWVFRGNDRSGLFKRAIPFGRHEAQQVFTDTIRWLEHRTELQTIGSYTRAVRRIEGSGEEWLRSTCLS